HGSGLAAAAGAGAVGGVVFLVAGLLVGALGRREWDVLRGAAARVPRRSGGAGLALTAVAVLAALYAPVTRDLAHVWLTVPYYSYGFLVPVFSAWLLWDARAQLASPRPAWSPAALALLVGGLAMLAAGLVADSLALRAVSLPAALGGAAWLTLGGERAAAVAFPLGFLVFMAPLPDAVVPAVSPGLQHLAAWFTAGVLTTAGIPTEREGLLVRIPGVILHITEACNGVRFLLAMIVLGTAFAWTTQARLARRATVLALAVVVALVANLVRVAGTGLLAHYWGPEAATGFAHVAYGKLVYFAMMIPFVAGVLVLRRAGRVPRVPDVA
ncbi:MAG: exosortase/archaeosortase family protein, partial [Candidatus Rokuibacteriota bacterium]